MMLEYYCTIAFQREVRYNVIAAWVDCQYRVGGVMQQYAPIVGYDATSLKMQILQAGRVLAIWDILTV